MTVYVQRDANSKICGVYANLQPGYAEEALDDTNADVVAYLNPPPRPVTAVSPRQARLALLQQGLLDKVQAAVTAAGGATQITWEYATVFDRHDPLIASIGTSLALTSEQIDQLFVLANTL